ncbi:MAG: ABC transporter substrate-binding protein, partial [Chloroflexota bacterium]
MNARFSRRRFVGALATGGAMVLVAACSAGSPATSTPSSSMAAQPTAKATTASQAAANPVAASPATASGKTTIELIADSWVIQEWDLPKWVKQYNANSKSQVNLTQSVTGWDTKVLAMIRQGNLLWDGHGIMTPFIEKVQDVETEMIQPVDGLIQSSTQPDAPKIVADLVPTIKSDISYKGKLYGIPYSVEAIGQMWLTQFTDGVGVKENPPTWSTTLDAAMKIKETYAASQKVTPYAFNQGLHTTLQALIHSGSKTPYTSDGLLDMTGAVSLKACDWLVSLAKNGLTPPHLWDGAYDLWQKKKLGLFLAQNSRGVWAQRIFGMSAAGTGAVPLMEQGSDSSGSPFWSNTFTVFNKAKHPQELVDFYVWLLGPSNKDVQQAIISSGKAPVFNSVYSSMIQNNADYKWMADFLPVIAGSMPYPENTFWNIQNAKILPWISKMASPPFSLTPAEAMQNALKDVQAEVAKQK